MTQLRIALLSTLVVFAWSAPSWACSIDDEPRPRFASAAGPGAIGFKVHSYPDITTKVEAELTRDGAEVPGGVELVDPEIPDYFAFRPDEPLEIGAAYRLSIEYQNSWYDEMYDNWNDASSEVEIVSLDEASIELQSLEWAAYVEERNCCPIEENELCETQSCWATEYAYAPRVRLSASAGAVGGMVSISKTLDGEPTWSSKVFVRDLEYVFSQTLGSIFATTEFDEFCLNMTVLRPTGDTSDEMFCVSREEFGEVSYEADDPREAMAECLDDPGDVDDPLWQEYIAENSEPNSSGQSESNSSSQTEESEPGESGCSSAAVNTTWPGVFVMLALLGARLRKESARDLCR